MDDEEEGTKENSDGGDGKLKNRKKAKPAKPKDLGLDLRKRNQSPLNKYVDTPCCNCNCHLEGGKVSDSQRESQVQSS